MAFTMRSAKMQDITLGDKELESHAMRLALEWRVRISGQPDTPSLEPHARRLLVAYTRLHAVAAVHELPPAAEWLLDNYYLLEENIRDLRERLDDLGPLPVISGGEREGVPRAYLIAAEMVAHSEGYITEEKLEGFIHAFQRESGLTMGEIWAMPIMLRVALVQLAAEVAFSCLQTLKQKQRGLSLAKECAHEPKRAYTLIGKNEISLSGAFLESLTRDLEAKEAKEALTILDIQLSLQDIDAKKSIKAAHVEQAQGRVLIGNAITSLRHLALMPWEKMFERLSLVESALREDDIYPTMDYDSRDYYRKSVERLAGRLRVSETQVAKTALSLAKQCEGREGHVGHFLIEDGTRELINRLRPGEAGEEKGRRLGMYVLGIAAIALLIIAPMTIGLYDSRVWLVMLLGAVPAFTIAKTVMDRFLVWLTPPSFMPRLSISGHEKDLRTAVVVPTLITGYNDALHVLEQLKIASHVNAQKELTFALLADFPNSGEQEIDSALVERISERFRLADEGGRFVFLLRRRVACPDGTFGGYERKRGALMQFNDLLLTRDASAFAEISSPMPSGVKYVITLDADTVLPRGAAAKLIGAIAHPLNRPRMSLSGHRVEHGHAVLQPRIAVLPKNAVKTRFSRIYSGSVGIDSYAFAISDVYQDVFGEGIFTGKGIYDVNAFSCVLKGILPDNRILSHDLLEGSIARAGLVSDITLYDGYPSSYRSYSRRQHRWTRGDWQLLPFLGGRWRTSEGVMIKNPLSTLDKFKLLDNLRRSLVPVAVMASLLLAFSGHPIAWAVISLVALVLPLLLDVGARILQWLRLSDKRPHLRHMLSDLTSSAAHLLLCALFLPQDAFCALDAITRTLVRLVTKKRLLVWETAAQSESGFTASVSGYYRLMPASIIAAALALSLSLIFAPDALVIALPAAIAWVLAPLTAAKLGEPVTRGAELEKPELNELREYAKTTWQFFESYMTEEFGFLPPDNVQEMPKREPVKRTSPTNIGLGMLSLVCAFDLGFIKLDELLKRLDGMLDSVESAEKWCGCLYNWYEIPGMRPLFPRFVSTVDCGNLIGCAMVSAQALLEIGGCERQVERLNALADMHELVRLYDQERDLFVIGYDVEANKASGSYYDLLASEARLTSFIAIARGEIPERHWFKLGRSLTTVGERRALVSWSGTMFEYLMPLLLMEDYPHTLLNETCEAAVEAQRRFTDGKRPWGVSESGFYEFDLDLYYQYRAFGIPKVGLKSAAVKDIVVAPYASMLALMVDPCQAIENLRTLKVKGALGRYGFYEALDYTPERVSGENPFMMVKSYMSHHQGMSFVALANVLCDFRTQRRFHSILAVKASELLLQERVPRKSVVIREYREALPKPVLPGFSERTSFVELKPTPKEYPEAHLLGGQDYSVCLTSKGGGFSRWGDINVNRWRADPVRGLYGMYFYIAENGGKVWSPCVEPDSSEGEFRASFEADKAVFERRVGKLRSTLCVCVSPEYPSELRRLTIYNEDSKGVALQISAFFEVSLAKHADDVAHSAFQNLFVEAQAIEDTLCFARRKRRDSDPDIHMAAALHGSGELSMSSDRLMFIGRGRTPQNASRQHRPYIENPLDPAACLTREVYVKAGERLVLTLAIACGESREGVVEIVRSFKDEPVVERTYSLAWTHAQVELHAGADVKWFPRAIAPLLFPDRRRAEQALRKNALAREGLWRLGISGDWTLLLAEANEGGVANVKQLLSLHEYLRRKGMKVDLVILSMKHGEYHQSEREKLLEAIRTSSSRHVLGASGGVHLVSLKDISRQEYTLLKAVSAVHIDAEKPLGPQFTRIARKPPKSAGFPKLGDSRSALAIERPAVVFDNGFGGFTQDGTEYVIRLRDGETTPMPWCNVMSNGTFGTIVSERGGGFSFTHNARENSLTPWRNDPVSDPLSEHLLLRDESTGRVWHATHGAGEYIVRHGFGYSRYDNGGEGLKQSLIVYIDPVEPVKVFSLELHNPLALERELCVMLAAEWTKERVGTLDGKDTLLARDPWAGDVGFMAFPGHEIGCCCDRREFFGGAELARWERDTSGDCALGGIMAKLTVPSGGSVRIVGLLGEVSDPARARNIVGMYNDPDSVKNALDAVRNIWRRRFTIKVKTPDAAFDMMMNGWLLYQLWSSRLLGRTGYYQAGGAYGFRDQLQDTLALLHSAPERTREQILIAAGHQFEAGDVQHWWHPPARGVRTRIKDDRLFLPYVTMAYAKATGDSDIWDEDAPYLEDVKLGERNDVYQAMKPSGASGPVFEHCVKAIDATLEMGAHGLPLMGTGDWNDGMDEVGAKGFGESVWLGFFLLDVLRRFAQVCSERGEQGLASRYLGQAQELVRNLEEHGWDGAWYRRAFTDEGVPLGSALNSECRIDLISQAWAVLSGENDKERCDMAMDSALERLLMGDEGVLRLLAPAFDKETPSPGYIRGYIPGVRENGGQYTHGAIWGLLALAKSGRGERAMEIFSMLNPISHTATRLMAARYKGEPYVMAADVYSARHHEGRAGWTWYTGAASWMYQAGLEGILGVEKEVDMLTINPVALCEWPEIEMEYRFGNAVYHFRIRRGEQALNNSVALVDDGKRHEISVVVP